MVILRKSFLSLITLMLVLGCQAETTSEAIEQNIHVKLDVPDTTWSLKIDAVYEVDDTLWVISALQQAGQQDGMMGIGLMVITTLEDKVTITAPKLPVKHYITGKTWGWENKEPYQFIDDVSVIQSELDKGKKVFQRKE